MRQALGLDQGFGSASSDYDADVQAVLAKRRASAREEVREETRRSSMQAQGTRTNDSLREWHPACCGSVGETGCHETVVPVLQTTLIRDLLKGEARSSRVWKAVAVGDCRFRPCIGEATGSEARLQVCSSFDQSTAPP